MTAAAATVVSDSTWNARLALTYAHDGARTLLSSREHFGPLVVQRPLYPEGSAVCQSVIVHPPGGIAGGDRLSIDIVAGRDSCAQLTTPGATKWYKSNGRDASQHVRIRAARNAVVEWLPLENIVYDGAVARSSIAVELEGNACAAGWDIVAYGRTASGERYAQGRFRQSVEIARDDKLLWAECGDTRGSDALFASPIGYAGHSVSALMWLCMADAAEQPTIDACRTVAVADVLTGVTAPCEGVVVVRCLADSTETARRYLAQVWAVLRPAYMSRAAVEPRLWAT